MVFSWVFSSDTPSTALEDEQLVKELGHQIPEQVAEKLSIYRKSNHALYRRFLVASKWRVQPALESLCQHAAWLDEHSTVVPVEDVDVGMVLPNELKQRKLFFQGQDIDGRPVMYVRFAASRPAEVPLHERKLGLIWGMEWMSRLADKLPGSDGKITIVFDMRNCGTENMDSQGASMMVDILQKQYPERLGRLLVYEAPSYFWVLWNMVWPFLTAETQAKVKMVYGEAGLNELREVVPKQTLPKDLGGEAELLFCVDAVEAFNRNGCL